MAIEQRMYQGEVPECPVCGEDMGAVEYGDFEVCDCFRCFATTVFRCDDCNYELRGSTEFVATHCAIEYDPEELPEAEEEEEEE